MELLYTCVFNYDLHVNRNRREVPALTTAASSAPSALELRRKRSLRDSTPQEGSRQRYGPAHIHVIPGGRSRDAALDQHQSQIPGAH